ncbi:MAG TPA: hypothetical protein PLB89_06880 [Flavobacteriales bacterium]|nr:hypothetical protein [Flavobacteriales bacterium]
MDRKSSSAGSCRYPTVRVVTLSGAEGWQRNYWDRVIRDDAEHERIAQYIADNPANWKNDRMNR